MRAAQTPSYAPHTHQAPVPVAPVVVASRVVLGDRFRPVFPLPGSAIAVATGVGVVALHQRTDLRLSEAGDFSPPFIKVWWL
jgi:hypothetical protein